MTTYLESRIKALARQMDAIDAGTAPEPAAPAPDPLASPAPSPDSITSRQLRFLQDLVREKGMARYLEIRAELGITETVLDKELTKREAQKIISELVKI